MQLLSIHRDKSLINFQLLKQRVWSFVWLIVSDAYIPTSTERFFRFFFLLRAAPNPIYIVQPSRRVWSYTNDYYRHCTISHIVRVVVYLPIMWYYFKIMVKIQNDNNIIYIIIRTKDLCGADHLIHLKHDIMS